MNARVPRNGSAAATAYRMLREQIVRGTLGAGDRLIEEEIAADLSISRSPVREALRRLADDGLIDLTPNRGASVTRWDAEDFRDLLDIRAILEGYGTWRAASRLNDAELDVLAALCDEAEDAAARGRLEPRHLVADINQRFHLQIMASAGNRRLVDKLSGLSHVPLLMGIGPDDYAAAMTRTVAHHREIVSALRARDGEWARATMQSHILAAKSSHRGPLSETTRKPTATATGSAPNPEINRRL